MLITFREFKRCRVITGICKLCGKKRKRTIKETMTLNPFNKNEDGTVRTALEIDKLLNQKVEKESQKLTANFICASCRG